MWLILGDSARTCVPEPALTSINPLRCLTPHRRYHSTNPIGILAHRAVQQAAVRPCAEAHPDPPSNYRLVGEVSTVEHKALYRVSEAMRVLSMSRTVIYEQLRTGRLRSVHQGRARRIPASAIADYVSLLERESSGRAA
jgi:excisionase family DNA binding protein